jgi:hypothetical protein
MGVYHLMGLGRSAGAVTGPLSYLAHRYQRWDNGDQRFFARSGEQAQRERGEKVGDVQAVVLFTTQEVLTGALSSFGYVENPPGRITEKPLRPGGPMKEVLRDLLKKEWPGVSGDRPAGTVFWCEVDRRDIRTTYGRVVQVVAALAGVGGQGKEMWINLTGGNNVINFALELAATLSGDVARLYYVQAENPAAEKCVRFTAENGYWVELPMMPLALGRLSQVILDLLQKEEMDTRLLYGILRSQYWDLGHGLDSPQTLREDYLRPLWKHGLIAEARKEVYTIGPQWKLIQPYQETLRQARDARLTIEKLARQATWIEQEKIPLG